MPAPPPKPLSQARALSCALMNLCATPGLGSLLGRQTLAGTGQLLFAGTGFALLLGWMGQFFYRIYLQQLDQPVPSGSYGWLGKWGVIFFGAGWLWSLVTSLSLLRQAKMEAQANANGVPPRIGEMPAAKPGRPD